MGHQVSSYVCDEKGMCTAAYENLDFCTARRHSLWSFSDDKLTFRRLDTQEVIIVDMVVSIAGSCPLRGRYGSGSRNPMTRPRITISTDNSDDQGKRASSSNAKPRQGYETFIPQGSHKSPVEWPATYRWQPRHWFHCVTNDGHQYLLQITANLDDRIKDKLAIDMQDFEGVRTLAHKFNEQIGKKINSCVQVCTPMPVEIMNSHLPALLGVGDVGLLIPYPGAIGDIEKFVFDNQTDKFVDLPSAFFHYAMFITQGKQMVVDIQGEINEDGDLMLIDPVLLQVGTTDPRVFCGVLPGGIDSTTFEILHPQCTPICSMFDPKRKARTPNGRQMCGIGCDIQVRDLNPLAI